MDIETIKLYKKGDKGEFFVIVNADEKQDYIDRGYNEKNEYTPKAKADGRGRPPKKQDDEK